MNTSVPILLIAEGHLRVCLCRTTPTKISGSFELKFGVPMYVASADAFILTTVNLYY